MEQNKLVQTEIPQEQYKLFKGVEPVCDFVRDQPVVIVRGNMPPLNAVFGEMYDFRRMCKVFHGRTEFLVSHDELVSMEEHERQMELKTVTELKKRKTPLIEAWNSGHRNIHKLAKAIGTDYPGSLVCQILQLQKHKIISGDKYETGEPKEV
jgi:hypothetical protein